MGFVGRGRDLLTGDDGAATVLGEVVVRGTIAPGGELLAIAVTPGTADLGALVGAPVGRGFRARVQRVLADDRDRCSLLHLLLDDLPVASLVSGYGEMRELPGIELSPAAAARMVDLCAGWQAGATMLRAVEDTGLLPTPIGPAAPELTSSEDPLGWHDLPDLRRGELRRRRRLDLERGDPLSVDAMFRDSHRAMDGDEGVLHEYQVAATIDRVTLEVRSAVATPRVLPWPECPRAAASASRIAGQAVGGLRAHVLSELTGVETCTHLNDALRSLADVVALIEVLG